MMLTITMGATMTVATVMMRSMWISPVLCTDLGAAPRSVILKAVPGSSSASI
jgi:hypothetical protein